MVRFKQVSCGEDACQTLTRAPTPPSHAHMPDESPTPPSRAHTPSPQAPGRGCSTHPGAALRAQPCFFAERSGDEGFFPSPKTNATWETQALQRFLSQRFSSKMSPGQSCSTGPAGPCNLVWVHCIPAWRSNEAEASQEEGGLG